MDLLVYSPVLSERLKYVCEEFFGRRCELSVNHTSDPEQYTAFDGIKLNYSDNAELPGLHVIPAGLLNPDTSVQKPLKTELLGDKQEGVLFPTNGAYGNDFLTEVFFHLSRWEEYSASDFDQYGRFKAENSVLFQMGLLHKPVVELRAKQVMDDLGKMYPQLSQIKRKYRYIPTVDIDNAYAYKYKSSFRTLASTVNDIAKLRFRNFVRRINVLMLGEHDPYDTYGQLDNAHATCKERPIFFFLLANEARYDRNLSFSNPAMKNLVERTAEKCHLGIHPGMGSNLSFESLKEEKRRLELLSGSKCLRSRQHYLYLRFPKTYQDLAKAGISEDYTMGYASQAGFRAGTCLPFGFYDLNREKRTELTIYPFAFMDATLHLYLGLNESEALNLVEVLSNEIRAVQGMCISLWHNETLSGMWHWKGWENTYSKIVSICES